LFADETSVAGVYPAASNLHRYVHTYGCDKGGGMVTDQGCGEIDKLVERIRQASAEAGDPLGELAQTIRILLQGEVDPYLLAGVLIEGAVQSIVQRIPAEQQLATSRALMRLLLDRLRAEGGTAPPPE
jgi:hypothetical protein